jgi:NDP-sugar pyrophosphorylase family protein
MAIKKYEYQNPYGVIKLKGIQIVELEEKPVTQSYVNAGVYVFNPKVLKFIKKSIHMDTTDLISQLLAKKNKIIAYPIHEKWNDIGVPSDYENINSEK